MTDQRRQSRQTLDSQSIISRCGSISGETFVSLRSRRNCNPNGRAPLHSVDLLAKTLKDYHTSQTSLAPDNLSCCGGGVGNEVEKINRVSRVNRCFHHYRFVIAMLAGMSVGIMLFLRYSMTIAILRMVNQTHLYLEEHPNKTMQDFLDEGYVPGGEFIWNNEMVAIILGWYMFAYTLPQTLAAKLNVVMGCRFSIPICLSLCAISNLLVPAASYMGWQWVVACRLLNGLGAAGVLPGMLNLLEDWMRYDEISSGLTTGQFVVACMTACCPLISGYLTAIHWSLSFYVPSYVTLAFCAVWLLMVTNKPRTNWLISERELDHLCDCNMTDPIPTTKGIAPTREQNTNSAIQEKHKAAGVETGSISQPAEPVNSTAVSVGPVNGVHDRDDNDDELEYKPDSWIQILKLRSFYAYLFIWMINCSSYTGFTFILPAYMRQFLKIRISENGFYCFVIQLGFLFAVSWPHQLLRFLLSRNLTMTRARICAQALCSFMMAATFIYVGTCHKYQMPLLFLNRCFVGTDVIVTGSVMSNFAKAGLSSMAFAMINTIGNLSITGSSTLIGWLLDYTGSSALGWRIIFCGLGAAQIIMFLTFALFIDSDPIKFRNKSNKRRKQFDGSHGVSPSSVYAIDSRCQQQQDDNNFKRLATVNGK